MEVSLVLPRVSLMVTFCAARKELHFPMGSPKNMHRNCDLLGLRLLCAGPHTACECFFIFLCHAPCLSRLGALHHSYNTSQPDL